LYQKLILFSIINLSITQKKKNITKIIHRFFKKFFEKNTLLLKKGTGFHER
jgi:hypothetical protein